MGVHPDRVTDAEFRALYEREHAGQVRRAALLLGSSEQAHDVVHDAMVELYARWDTIVQPGAYLNRVVLNRCRDATRRAPRAAAVVGALGGSGSVAAAR